MSKNLKNMLIIGKPNITFNNFYVKDDIVDPSLLEYKMRSLLMKVFIILNIF